MRLPAGFAVGAATHTGLVRRNNEDDYLLGTLGSDGDERLLAAVADGIGGAVGGAEASRAALRGFSAVVLDPSQGMAESERLAAGMLGAKARLAEQVLIAPFLREMGTTLTALLASRHEVHFAHIGDSRLYLLRGGACTQCTQDHAAREPDNVLLAWLGGSRSEGQVQYGSMPTQLGDRWLLVSDGIWGVLQPAELARIATAGKPQQAAERLIAAAMDQGGPDNCTALVVDRSTAAAKAELPLGETPRNRERWPTPRRLVPPRWPLWLLLLSLLLLAELLVRRFFGLDWIASFQQWFRP